MFYLFFSHLGIGLLACLAFLPLKRLGSGFFRFNALLALAFLVVAAAAAAGGSVAQARNELVACIALGAAYVVSLRFGGRVVSSALLYAAIAVGFVTIVREAWAWGDAARTGALPRGLLLAQFVTSAALLGAVLLDMILGHWYLVIPGLSFGHLQRMTRILALVLAARLVVSAWGVGSAWPQWASAWSADASMFMLEHGLFLILRFVFGILGPAALLVLVWRCVRIGSNTSATGILYVATAIILIGEIASHWFLSTHAVLV